MKPGLYIETSIVSYLTSRPSRDLIIAARQELTRESWSNLKSRFDIFISALVVQEAGRGDSEASASRLTAVDGIPVLDVTDSAKVLAQRLIQGGVIPDTHVEDALHVAVAATNGYGLSADMEFQSHQQRFHKIADS